MQFHNEKETDFQNMVNVFPLHVVFQKFGITWINESLKLK